MSQAFSGFLKVALVLALAYFILWGLGQFGVIDSKAVILGVASFFPNLNDLPQNYELGKKRSEVLAEKEKQLRDLEQKLKRQEAMLAAERDKFKDEKNQWQNQHPVSSATVAAPKPNYVNPPMPGSFAPPTSDQKLKEYLTRVGSMKPKQAAAVIQKLPEETVFAIFDLLRPYQVSQIMENLPEAYLAKLTQDRLNKYRNI